MSEKYRPKPEETKNKKPAKKGSTRRAFIGVLGTAAAVGIARHFGEGNLQAELAKDNKAEKLKPKENETVSETAARKPIKPLEPIKPLNSETPAHPPENPNLPNVYNTKQFNGRKFGSLAKLYTGINETVRSETMELHFDDQLKKMWDRKIELSGNNPNVIKLAQELQSEYQSEPKEKITFDDYRGYVQLGLDDLKQNLDLEKVAKKDGLDQPKQLVLERICNSIDANDLLAYSLTEIMPSPDDGKFNIELLNFLLSNAGRQYVESIPSLGDRLVSFGPYQFTEMAVYNGLLKKGAVSKINNLLDKAKRIPNSLTELRGSDHHKAAYLFLVENVASLLKHLSKSELGTFNRAKKSDILSYIAVAHHKPSTAKKFAYKWLSATHPGAFQDYCQGEYLSYAQKTQNNFKALAA